MPLPHLKNLHKETGISMQVLERFWEEAKKSAKKSGHSEDYPYIMSIFHKMVHGHRTTSSGPLDLHRLSQIYSISLPEARDRLSYIRDKAQEEGIDPSSEDFIPFAMDLLENLRTDRDHYKKSLPKTNSPSVSPRTSPKSPPINKNITPKVSPVVKAAGNIIYSILESSSRASFKTLISLSRKSLPKKMFLEKLKSKP